LQLPKLKIGRFTAEVPIIQGGMGVGISLAGLASAVANEGGIGVISGVAVNFREPDFRTNYRASAIRALKKEINRARKLSPQGIIGLNILTALNNFNDLAKTAAEENIDIIFAGAGLPLNLPQLINNDTTALVPIVSSGRAAHVICKNWSAKYNIIPDAIVVEGPLAGGHLGFSLEQIKNKENFKVEDIAQEVKKVIQPFEYQYRQTIPVIAAGGIFDGEDIAAVLNRGLDGAQLGTRFVATYECDAHQNFKNAYLKAQKEDLVYIKSPVGLIGSALKNKFLEDVEKGIKKPIRCRFNCLKTCNPKESPYCIADALLAAREGDLENGFAFAGYNVYRINRLLSVKELMKELVGKAKEYYCRKTEPAFI